MSNNMTLPTQWTIKYSQEGVGSGSSMIQFDMQVANVQTNVNVTGVSFRIGN